MQLSIADDFFNDHPLKEHYFSFSEAERAGTLAVAERDILALLAGNRITEAEREFFQAAIAEQSIFLMLNPEYLTGAYTRTVSISSSGYSRKFSGQESVLGQRAATLLNPILLRISEEKSSNEENNPGNDGDTGENGGRDEEHLCRMLCLNRG